MVAKKQELIGQPSLVKRKIIQIGTAKGISLPETALNFLGVQMGDEIEMNAYNGKYGKFLAVWVPQNKRK